VLCSTAHVHAQQLMRVWQLSHFDLRPAAGQLSGPANTKTAGFHVDGGSICCNTLFAALVGLRTTQPAASQVVASPNSAMSCCCWHCTSHYASWRTRSCRVLQQHFHPLFVKLLSQHGPSFSPQDARYRCTLLLPSARFFRFTSRYAPRLLPKQLL
jgi:hypothetical protein